ncbi:MAG: DNA-formamidopyrimidine glycosylase [Chloroflexi bacterium RBG_13_56_8]|nr:MAG: DNA-formamidopyrimidine glycosylase [Chloroflexi bacterium RBG_13_56_8]
MPELPEVETIVRVLREQAIGETIADVKTWWPRLIAMPSVAEFERGLMGHQVTEITRRGKFVVITLSPAKYLLVHLGMTGQLLVNIGGGDDQEGAIRPDAYSHVKILFESQKALWYRDVRKFGRLYLVDDPSEVLGDLGPEPLSECFTPRVLQRMLVGHRRRIKFLLMDQHFLAGLGNIYADESLWESGIHPLREACSLTDYEVERLHGALRSVLNRAVRNRGTTSRDYRDPENQPGHNQFHLAVYQRQGEPCRRCGQPVIREVMEQRGTHYCPICQPLRPGGAEETENIGTLPMKHTHCWACQE